MNGIVVVSRLSDWPIETPGVEVVTAWDYLTDDRYTRQKGVRVYNFCQSLGYQTIGYYVSLLANARGHRILPDTGTIQDLKLAESPSVVGDEIEDLIERSLSRIGSEHHVLNVYFGDSVAKRHQRLARALFNLFPAPLLQARFTWQKDHWRVDAIKAIALGDVPANHQDFLMQTARDYFARRRAPRPRRDSVRYDLAILINQKEAEPPSNARALKRFQKAAEQRGFSVDFLDKSDYGHVPEYDALFIRETTAVNHHTYRFARRAARERLVVIDHPDDILRCSNKVFLAQLLSRHRIARPKTWILHRANLDEAARELGFPMVIKQPDSQFSAGVLKVEDATALRRVARELFSRSELVVAQTFEPTDYDWRIGVLDGQPLYACRYFMASDHWQVVKRDATGKKHEGAHETIDIEDAPPAVVSMAVNASRAIGRGLYGVDLKQSGNKVKVIEVNDNPNIDAGVEDQFLGVALYQRIIDFMADRLDAQSQSKGSGDNGR